MKQNELQTLLALTCLAFVNATYKLSSEWPVLVFKKGETAFLPCPPQGHANAFFWRKGEWFNVSENIASIVHGIADTTEKYDVFGNGTLVIMNMSFDDEGKYYCRIASEKNECHGTITVYLEVSPKAIDITIQGCTSSSSCVKVLEPSLDFQLTCTANMMDESMTLKWYNGSKEIMGDADVSDTLGKKVKITNVIKFTFEDESHLICEAEGVSITRSKAAIQLKKKEVFIPVENKDALTLLVLTIVLGIICLILIGILIWLTVRQRKLKKEQGEVKDSHSTEMGAKPGNDKQEEEEQKAEKDPLFKKEENDADLATKQGELPRLQTELKETKTALEENKRELVIATTGLQKKENEAKRLQTELKETKEALEENKRELVIATTGLQKKENEAKQLKATGKQKLTAETTILSLQKDLEETNAKVLTSENEKKNLQKDLEEANANVLTSENEKKNLQKDLKEAKTKLLAFEDEKKNLQREHREANNKLLASENEKENLQREHREANNKLLASENEKENLQKDIKEAKTRLLAFEEEKKNLQREHREANTKLVASENQKKILQKDLQEERTKRSTSEDAKQRIISKIIEMKDNALRNLLETSPRVLIGMKTALFRDTSSYNDVLPKPKYSNVSLVSGPSYQGDIFDKITDKVKTCFGGTDTYIFLFGHVDNELHNTLHGENNYKGLIGRVAHLLLFLSDQLEQIGFQVSIHVSVASIVVEGKTSTFRNPSDRADGTENVKLRNGGEIRLNKYSVQSEKHLLEIASFMTPNRGNPKGHGLLKITVEALLGSTTVSKGSIFISSISNTTTLQKVFKGKVEDEFEDVLSVLTRKSRGDIIVITSVDPDVQHEPRQTFSAVKTILDAYH